MIVASAPGAVEAWSWRCGGVAGGGAVGAGRAGWADAVAGGGIVPLALGKK